MLNIAFNDNLDQKNEWHFIPAAFTDNNQTFIQNAKVKNYFNPNIKHQPSLSATFQGHLLKGVKSSQPNLYKAICYHSQDNQNNIDLILHERVRQCVDWNKDTTWKNYQGHVGTINKYKLIQSALHE